MNSSGENDGCLLFHHSTTHHSYPHQQAGLTIALAATTPGHKKQKTPTRHPRRQAGIQRQ